MYIRTTAVSYGMCLRVCVVFPSSVLDASYAGLCMDVFGAIVKIVQQKVY